MSDCVTILKCLGQLRLTKTWLADGSIRDYDDTKQYHLTERQVSNFTELVALLDRLAPEHQRAIIRGQWAGETLPSKADKIRRNLETFRDKPHHWLILDVDGFEPKHADPVRDPAAAVTEFIETRLPAEFLGASCRWQLSSSAGRPGKEHLLKAHLAFWLATPYGSGALKAWKLARGIDVDGALFNAVQLHFTADPVFEAGVEDPVPVRSGVIEGWTDEVDLVIPESLLVQVKAREANASAELPDPTEKPGVLGAFCRAYSIDRCLEEFELPYEFETPGDDRRLNFLDGSGAPGGAFITPCRNYLVCKHNSDPFLNRAVNAFDLVRHYRFGHLDDADDAFDADPTNSTSYHRMVEWARTLPDVSVQVEAAREAAVEAAVEASVDVGEDLLAQLRAMTLDEIQGRWVELLMDVGPIAEDAAIGHLAAVLRTGRRPLQQALRRAREARASEARRQAIERRRADRVQILYQPESVTRQAAAVERLILDNTHGLGNTGEYCRFAGLLSHLVAKPLPKAHGVGNDNAPCPETMVLTRMNQPVLRSRVEQVAVFTRAGDGPPTPCEVPQPILSALGGIVGDQVPTVSGLITNPVVLLDGTILSEEGFDERTGLLLTRSAVVPGCRPYSQREAQAALARISDCFLSGFEFSEPLDKTLALAGLFTAVERRALAQAPGLVISASAQSTGKTTLARRIHLVLTGRDLPVVSYPSSKDEAEKLVFSLLLASPAMVCFDNIPDGHTFQSSILAAVMTAETFSQRILGCNESADVPTDTFWTLTGNQLSLGKDELSRFLFVRLVASCLRPDKRQFAHPDVVGHALSARDQVLRDIVGIVSGFRLSGDRVPPDSRFGNWDGLVRQPLLWAGGGDASAGFDRNHSESEDAMIETNVLAECYRVFGQEAFTTDQLRDRVDPFETGTDAVLKHVLTLGLEHRNYKNQTLTHKPLSRMLKSLCGKRMSVHGVQMWLSVKTMARCNVYRVCTEFDEL